MRLAYADPPYPGKAELYAEHPDYAGEVDHRELIGTLCSYDGWALSTGSWALQSVLALCPVGVRVLVWTKHSIARSWEPLIVWPARNDAHARHLRDWIRVEPEYFQWRPKPDSYVIGQKPEPFSMWMFEWLGAREDDTLDDLFPGSGAVGAAWDKWRARQPSLLGDRVTSSVPNRGSVRYRTIVADPPWPHERTGLTFTGDDGQFVSHTVPYETMMVEEIAALPIKKLAEADRWHVNGERGGSHLYLWTTQQFLWEARDVARAWGFPITAVLVWCKPPRGFGMGGTFVSNVEFILFGRRGSPPAAPKRVPTQWFEWPRGRHSEKPEAFFDLVEGVSPEPRLELFARRNRLGWDTWGNEALEHVEIVA